MSETCYAIASWEGGHLCCTLPVNHKTLLEHYDGNRGLRWLGEPGNVSAWPGTEAEVWAFVASVDRSLRGES